MFTQPTTLIAPPGVREWQELFPAGPPSARQYALFSLDTARNRITLFGGNTGATYSTDLFEWNGVAGTWDPLVSGGVVPLGRMGMLGVYDQARVQHVMFGGYTNFAVPALSSQTYTLDGPTTWALKAPVSPPVARAYMAGVYDPVRALTYMMGGYDGAPMAGTSSWNGVNWQHNVAAGTSPSARWLHRITFDIARGVSVMFGGTTLGLPELLNQTHTFDGTTWVLKTPTHSPPARYSPMLAYNVVRRVVVLFGGCDATDTVMDDMWEWDGNDWTEIFPLTSPPARRAGMMQWDSARARIHLFGGANSADVVKGDDWQTQ